MCKKREKLKLLLIVKNSKKKIRRLFATSLR